MMITIYFEKTDYRKLKRLTVKRRFYDFHNTQDGVLCDNSQRLETINYCHKELHLRCCSSPRSASDVYSQLIEVVQRDTRNW